MKFVATFEVSVDIDAKNKAVAARLCRDIDSDLQVSVAGCHITDGCYSYKKKSASLKNLKRVKNEKNDLPV